MEKTHVEEVKYRKNNSDRWAQIEKQITEGPEKAWSDIEGRLPLPWRLVANAIHG